jgi:hypothetical protein
MSEVNHAERAHSSLGASSMERWATCPASVKLSEGLPNPSSPYAAEGTIAHELCEIFLTDKSIKPESMIGESIEPHPEVEITQEMIDAVMVYVDFVEKEGKGKDISLEERVTLEHIDGELFGTNDCVIYEEFGELHVIDYKHGQGYAVEARENKQLLYYASGAGHGLDYSAVRLTIVQPRCDHPDGPIRSWVTTPDRIKEFERELKLAVDETRKAKAKFQPSEKGCKWCLAKHICPALKTKALSLAKDQFADVVELPKPMEMTGEEISKTLKNASLIETWLKSVQKYAHTAAEAGESIEGYKLVKAKKNRAWRDSDALIEEFGDLFDDTDLYAPKKLKTPAQLEKIVGKADVARFSETPEGGLNLVKESDKRAAVTMKAISAKDQFAEEEDEFDI